MTPELLAAAVGLVLFLIIQLAKRSGIPAQFIIIGACALAGILYNVFSTFVPLVLQQNIISFLSISFTTSWTLYELVWNGYKKISQGV